MIGANTKIEELKKKRRSLDLIANFVDGYAEGWHFAVKECFRDELDIRYTKRKEPILINDQPQYDIKFVNGKQIKKKRTKEVMRWTQGPFYSFAEGHIIYDTPLAFQQWSESLTKIRLACIIFRATPNDLDSSGNMTNGMVSFLLKEPDHRKKTLVEIGQYHLTQNRFVDYLRTGKIDETSKQTLPSQISLF